LKKEIKENYRRFWKDLSCLWIDKINIAKMTIITKINLPVQYYLHQHFNDIHQRDWKINPKFHLEAQKTTSSQGNTEQKEEYWRYHNTWLQIILQNHSNKNSMVLA
jgi:hypothetical protein